MGKKAKKPFFGFEPNANGAAYPWPANHRSLTSVIVHTVARWPIFRPNNSKQAGKKYFWPEKIGGRTATNFAEKLQKTGRKKLFHFFQKQHL
jgi:hypothetical protein